MLIPFIGITLGILELIFVAIFVLLVSWGCVYERKLGKNEQKWWAFSLGLIAIFVYLLFWKDFSLSGMWKALFTVEFWKPIGIYLLAGLAYSLIEFLLEIRRSVPFFKNAWQKQLAERVYRDDNDVWMPLKEAIVSDNESAKAKALQIVKSFINNTTYERNSIIRLKADENGLPEPRVSRQALSDAIAAWTVLWPFYLLASIFGDWLIEIINLIVRLFIKLSQGLVKFLFKDVFKI